MTDQKLKTIDPIILCSPKCFKAFCGHLLCGKCKESLEENTAYCANCEYGIEII